ncbi:MAG: N-acetyltransferase, partial [Azoarcus sp.]|nr:N-acetyltransferase [Azoarcus sp.]
MNDNIHLRRERLSDHAAIEKIVHETFKNAPRASGNEALLAHKLRALPAFVPELDFVAEMAGNVVAGVMYTRARVVAAEGEWETLVLGPIGVLPAYQRRGIGTALIRHTQGNRTRTHHNPCKKSCVFIRLATVIAFLWGRCRAGKRDIA